jgi:hypothetical protein
MYIWFTEADGVFSVKPPEGQSGLSGKLFDGGKKSFYSGPAPVYESDTLNE